MTDFESIYHQYFREVYLFVLKLSGNEKVAEEITQETFFKALKGIDSFQGHCKVNVWLCQIAKNTYFTYLQKQKHYVTDEMEEPVGEDLVDTLISKKEESFRIHKVLHTLDEPYKEVFTLRIFGELSFKQISELFGRTESWARVTFYRGKQKLQEKLGED